MHCVTHKKDIVFAKEQSSEITDCSKNEYVVSHYLLLES